MQLAGLVLRLHSQEELAYPVFADLWSSSVGLTPKTMQSSQVNSLRWLTTSRRCISPRFGERGRWGPPLLEELQVLAARRWESSEDIYLAHAFQEGWYFQFPLSCACVIIGASLSK